MTNLTPIQPGDEHADDPPPPAPDPPTQAGDSGAQAPGRGPIRVILAEDHDDSRDIYAHALQRAGMEVDAVADGAQALSRATERMPDVIVLDVWMPVLGGVEAAAAIKANRQTSHIPVILMSAGLAALPFEHTRDVCDLVCTKPLLPADLVAAVRGLLPLFELPAGERPALESDESPD